MPPEQKSPLNLDRFVEAQAHNYEDAVAELRAGRKTSHWMWYVFPQIQGLGTSAMSSRYSIKSEDEARAYLNHPILGRRLRECATIVLNIEGRSANEIFGSPDDMKLRSSATLFAYVSGDEIFQKILDKYFAGETDVNTIELLEKHSV
jgi:uncharacterized protein (DUF1810 family)